MLPKRLVWFEPLNIWAQHLLLAAWIGIIFSLRGRWFCLLFRKTWLVSVIEVDPLRLIQIIFFDWLICWKHLLLRWRLVYYLLLFWIECAELLAKSALQLMTLASLIIGLAITFHFWFTNTQLRCPYEFVKINLRNSIRENMLFFCDFLIVVGYLFVFFKCNWNPIILNC